MKLVRFANIAYNTPCVVAVDMSKEVQIYKRTVCDNKEVQFYIVSAFYDGESVQLEVISSVYNQLVKGYKESPSNMVYMFAHAEAGIYKSMNHREYFRLVRYDIVSKKRYIELSKDYGFKIYSEDSKEEEEKVSTSVLNHLSNSLLAMTMGVDEKRKVFSYSDIMHVIMFEEQYVRVSRGFGLKKSAEKKTEETPVKKSTFVNLLKALLISRLGVENKKTPVFSYSDIVNIFELSK